MELRVGDASFVMPLWPAAFPASVLGTFFGLVLVSLQKGPPNLEEDWLVLIYFSGGTFIFALLGLLIIGLPLTHLIKRVAFSPWSILLGTFVGGFAGRLITGLLGLDTEFSTGAVMESMGFLVGASTGFFWALLTRKRLVEIQEEEAQCID